jgi:alpha-glucosidase
MAPAMRYSNDKPLDPLVLKIFPLEDGQSSQYTLYEDAGDTRGYQQGQEAWTHLTAARKSNELTVTIAPVTGQYPGMPGTRAYELLLPGDWPPSSVEVNGKALNDMGTASGPGWRFEGNTLTTVINTSAFPKSEAVNIVVRRAANLEQRQSELDDFAGTMTRLREAYDALNQTWPIGWSPDDLVDAMQTGDRLSYHPELAGEQITHLRAMLPKVPSAIDELEKNLGEQQRQALAQRLKTEYKSDQEQNVGASYKEKLARARAAITDVYNPSH